MISAGILSQPSLLRPFSVPMVLVVDVSEH